jgi:MFS family permease
MGAFLFPLMAILLAAGVDLVDPGAQATTVSLVFGSALIVSAIAPAIAGQLADSQGIEAAMVLGAGIVLATALLSAVTQWRPKAALP